MTDAAEAEAAMRAALDAIMAGDLMTVMAAFTPEALNAAMVLGAGLTAAPSLTGYTIEAQTEANREQRFRIRFTTTDGDLNATANWRQLDGAWRVTAISLEGLT